MRTKTRPSLLHGALKKTLHERSRFSLCPPNSAIKPIRLKDSLPPPPAPAIMRPAWRPCLPQAGVALHSVRTLAPCFLFGTFFIYHSSTRYYPVTSTQVRYKIHIYLIIKCLFPAPSFCSTFQNRALICPRSGLLRLAKHSSKPLPPFQSAQMRAVPGQDRRHPISDESVKTPQDRTGKGRRREQEERRAATTRKNTKKGRHELLITPEKIEKAGIAYGTRTRVARVKGGSPGPLDERDF